MIPPSKAIAAYGSLFSRSLQSAFYGVALLNAGGLFLLLLVAFESIPSVFSPSWLRIPLILYLLGLIFAFMGLFWTHLVSVSLLAQSLAGRLRKSHWLAVLCATLSYALSLFAFVSACWFGFALAGVITSYESSRQELPKMHPPITPELRLQ